MLNSWLGINYNAEQSLQGVAPGADCPDGMTLNVLQKLRGKDLPQAIVCTLVLLLVGDVLV